MMFCISYPIGQIDVGVQAETENCLRNVSGGSQGIPKHPFSIGGQATLQREAEGCMGEDTVWMDKIYPKYKDSELLTLKGFPSN